MKTLFLCGFMGSGKTTVGKRAAALLGVPFTDLDAYIEEQSGMKIADIFAAHGEAHFRALETEALRAHTNTGGVIATGGGALVSADNAAIARAGGAVVFLDPPFALCYKRIQGDASRPIAFSKSKEELQSLFEARRSSYLAHSDYILAAEGPPLTLANALVELARRI